MYYVYVEVRWEEASYALLNDYENFSILVTRKKNVKCVD